MQIQALKDQLDKERFVFQSSRSKMQVGKQASTSVSQEA